MDAARVPLATLIIVGVGTSHDSAASPMSYLGLRRCDGQAYCTQVDLEHRRCAVSLGMYFDKEDNWLRVPTSDVRDTTFTVCHSCALLSITQSHPAHCCRCRPPRRRSGRALAVHWPYIYTATATAEDSRISKGR
ncbi:hypothetical protein BD626DRAFT_490931 [Schizophyllum amplum]|uniref:Uncharacterized protein n=1 Tax=Schizophyllum amplum TaxID=97359 RepID=A0A550CK09_9AGAR|nr:hypothetical protein BD626DRAFT_490931 [Auriculariopsis ampla]